MKFDAFWGLDDEATFDETDTLPLAPDGRHTGEIVKAEFKDLKFKVTNDNTQGTCLVVKVDVPKAQPVEAIIPCQYRGLIEKVCRAASIPLPVRGEDWRADQLLGRTVTIETVQGVGNSGREYVRIATWHPGPAALPEEIKRRPSPRTQAQKVTQELAADDIPF
jgi:hypothetical protein